MNHFPKIENLSIEHKRVFLRADLNVPVKNKQIIQDYKLQSIIPTIKYIQEKGGKVILATHIGRPNAQSQKNFFDENLSTKILTDWFEKNNFKIDYEIDLKKAEQKSKQDFDTILLLENLRFFNGEKEANIEFAETLKNCADLYVNDAFGLLHRNDASITLLPSLFKQNEKSFGKLIENEFFTLTNLKENPEQPFLLILGGNKIKDKTKLLKNIFEQPEKIRVQKILIGGAIANSFLQAQGINIGKSLTSPDAVEFAKSFLEKIELFNETINALGGDSSKKIKFILPTDVAIAPVLQNEKPEIVSVKNIPDDKMIVDIGPETIALFEQNIFSAQTIFTNGTPGVYINFHYQNGTRKILSAIAKSKSFSVVGGGDAVAATFLFGFENKINFLSTGGGATLTFLSCKNPFEEMPGLKALGC